MFLLHIHWIRIQPSQSGSGSKLFLATIKKNFKLLYNYKILLSKEVNWMTDCCKSHKKIKLSCDYLTFFTFFWVPGSGSESGSRGSLNLDLKHWINFFFFNHSQAVLLSEMGVRSFNQCCGAALFSRSREKRGGSGSSSTAQPPALTLCLKKRNKLNC